MSMMKKFTSVVFLCAGMLVCLADTCRAEEPVKFTIEVVIPEEATAKQYKTLAESIFNVMKFTQPTTEEQHDVLQTKRYQIALAITQKILTAEGITEDEFMETMHGRIQLINRMSPAHLHRIEETEELIDEVDEEIERIMAQAQNAKFDKAVFRLELVSLLFQFIRIHVANKEDAGNDETYTPLVRQLEAKLTKRRDMVEDDFRIFSEAGDYVPEKMAAAYYEKCYNAAKKVDAKMAESLFGEDMRQYQLLGKEIKISGTLIDGKPIDMAAKKGKVILMMVRPPWSEESLEIVPLYNKYHKKGFEVIEIVSGAKLLYEKETRDFNKENNIPWDIMFDEDTKDSGESFKERYPFMAYSYYMALVGKDGKVVTVEATVKNLEGLLEAQFPSE